MMNNPFQTQNRPLPKLPKGARQSNTFKSQIGLIGIAVTVAIALLWFARQGNFVPESLMGVLPTPSFDNRVFVAQSDLSHEQARALYREALSALQNSEYENALSLFKRLEPAFPGLKDMIWLHEAECYAGQGNEWAVQKKLNSLVEQAAHSPLKILALYRMGQSQLRGSEWEKAHETFIKVQAKAPQSEYATGSLYYLGALLSKEDATQGKAIEPLTAYLRQCSDCKFSVDAADLLEKLLPSPTSEEHGLMGLAYASAASKDLGKTLAHLEKGPISKTWLALGKTRIRAGKASQGVQTLVSGLPLASHAEDAQAAVDMALRHTAGDDAKKALLTALVGQHLQTGGDYALWKLAEALPEAQAQSRYQELLRQYPQSDYAPESGWKVLWPLLAQGQARAFLSQAQAYVDRYAYARSAPKAIFWMAKLQEKSNPTEAIRLYKRLQEDYAFNYYAFRAKSRLGVVANGKPDPGWLTQPARSNYPPPHWDLNGLDLLPPAEQFAMGQAGISMRDAALELQRIGAVEDTQLLVGEALGKLPPTIESWGAQVLGDRPKGIRAIRDALDAQSKEGFQSGGLGKRKRRATSSELKLLYPLYFQEFISQSARQQRLDPFLVQSLMREESYFNEFAISGSNARGLMQLLPSTAKEVAAWEGLSSFKTPDLFVPGTNIRLGSRYLGHLHELFQGNSMPSVGAYNGGPNAMQRWVKASAFFASDPDMFVERIPYEQSRDYIKKVFASYWNYHDLYNR